jgi:small subunit ribosomal protein S21
LDHDRWGVIWTTKTAGIQPVNEHRTSIEGTKHMPVIKIKDSESFEGAMKRFKKTCEKAGILTELRRREYYDKPSIRKKKKEAASRKRALKKLRRSMN